MSNLSHIRTLITILGLALLVSVPALAQVGHTVQESIKPGFDYWQTVGSGATKYSFADDPLPAGFLCRGSKPFSGTVTFEGVPLTTNPARSLGTADTIVERLETAKFDSKGFATTKIQVRALRFEGRETIKTSCGDFAVSASLAGPQPTTQMAFQLSDQCHDIGVFTANLDLNVALSFTNTSTGKVSSVNRQVSLPTFSDEAFAIGNVANRCPQTFLPAAQSVHVLNGTDVQFNVIGVDEFVATGCWCNCAGTQCLPILPEHVGPHESHFTMTPCEFFGGEFCEDPIIVDGIRAQVNELHTAGVITEAPAAATDKLVNKQY